MRAAVLVLSLAIGWSPAMAAPAERLWTDAAGVTASGREAMALLATAAVDGLETADYDVTALEAEAVRVCATPSIPSMPSIKSTACEAALGAFDERLTGALAHWLHDLHEGRVDPQRLGQQYEVTTHHHDFRAIVRAAATAHRVGALRDEFQPQLVQYAALRRALERYRALAREQVASRGSPRHMTLRPGDAHPDVAVVRQRLIAEGDLAVAPAAPRIEVTPVYGPELVEGVRRFQARHGLTADGVIGRATWQALEVPLAWRARQIVFALERLRWLPHLAHRVIAINIPMFELWAFDEPSGPPAFTTDVIVGQALRARSTPVMARQLREVISRPYWNVPRSILLNEIRPLVERDADYLRTQQLELVEGETDGSPVLPATATNLERLWQGSLRLRQRPGGINALGAVKFVFPNDADVYMHGTPASALFARDRRAFSHGCVRLRDPVGLAVWVLAPEKKKEEAKSEKEEGTTGWTRDRILAAMDPAALPSQRVRLQDPVQVLLFYTTAAVLPDGRVRFADDIYGHDGRLDRAMGADPRVSRLAGESSFGRR